MSGHSLRTPAELQHRRQRLESVLDSHDLKAIWFGRPNSFGWLTGGSNVVDRDSPLGVAAAGYERDTGFRVVTNTIEADRLRTEELPDAFELTAVEWYTDSLPAAVATESPTPAAADFDVAGCSQLDGSTIRQPLSKADIDRYRSLGRETATAVEAVCRELAADQSERAVAAAVRSELEARGIAAPVVLVGSSDRAPQYRHFTPTTAELGEYAIVSITAQRGGLYASLSRTVVFDPPEWLTARFEAAATVEATALAATRQAQKAGSTAGDVFERIQQAYETVGWPDEWQQHHQGGAAGFAGREWIATPSSADPVAAPQAYAWNPTVQGAKSEGTVLVAENGIEPLTMTDSWPTVSVSATEAADPPLTIDRPAPLSI